MADPKRFHCPLSYFRLPQSEALSSFEFIQVSFIPDTHTHIHMHVYIYTWLYLTYPYIQWVYLINILPILIRFLLIIKWYLSKYLTHPFPITHSWPSSLERSYVLLISVYLFIVKLFDFWWIAMIKTCNCNSFIMKRQCC